MPTCFGRVTILDYTHSQLIPIKTGTAVLQNGTFKIIHVFNIEEYESAFGDISNRLNEINKTHPLLPFLKFELMKSESDLRKLKPFKKQKRAIDALGTAWKWLAGSPDHHDKEIIINKINEQLENNNKQLIINKVLNDRIKQLSLITNNIIKATSENKNFIDEKNLSVAI